MLSWLTAQSHARPNGLALYADDQALTYVELDRQVSDLAAALVANGLGQGDRVAVLLSPSANAVCLIHAVLRIGSVLVALNTRLTPAELAYQIDKAQCRMVLCEASTSTLAHASAGHARVVALADLNAATAPAPVPAPTPLPIWPEVDLAAPAVVMFTSGTSGKPKGVSLTWGNFWHSAMASAYRIGVLPHDRWLCVLPLYHVGGLSILLRSCLYGTAVHLLNRPDVGQIDAALRAHPITLVSLVPTQLHRLLDVGASAAHYAALRLILLGGAAATPGLMARAVAAQLPIATTYGLTEATSQVATALPDVTPRKPAAVGKPLVLTEIKIVDAHGNPLPNGEAHIGEVIVRGPTIMQGYLDEPSATATALRDGWLYTGDLGFLDAEGDLHLVQRRSDLIVSGGENVYPAEVEAVLRRHPAVREVAVVGVPSAEWGQQVAAVIVAHAPVEPSELDAFCRQSLAGYKIPRRIIFVDALPLTASGKVDRVAVVKLV